MMQMSVHLSPLSVCLSPFVQAATCFTARTKQPLATSRRVGCRRVGALACNSIQLEAKAFRLDLLWLSQPQCM